MAILNVWLNVAALVAIAVAGFIGVRAKGLIEQWRNTSESWKEERDAEKAKADRIEAEAKDLLRSSLADKERLLSDNTELAKELAACRARTDLSGLEQRTTDAFAQISSLVAHHEERATERHERLLTVMDALTTRIGCP